MFEVLFMSKETVVTIFVYAYSVPETILLQNFAKPVFGGSVDWREMAGICEIGETEGEGMAGIVPIVCTSETASRSSFTLERTS